MLRIVRKSREQLIAAGFEAQLAERERVVRLLAEQVEYLRAQLKMPTATVSMAAAPPPVVPLFDLPEHTQVEAVNAISDAEEELLAMRQADVLSEYEYQQALERLKGVRAADIIE